MAIKIVKPKTTGLNRIFLRSKMSVISIPILLALQCISFNYYPYVILCGSITLRNIALPAPLR